MTTRADIHANLSTPRPLLQALLAYGAQLDQLVDPLADVPAALRYADLRKQAADWVPPVVIENERVPRVFVFDGRCPDGKGEIAQTVLDQWCRRIWLRGDPAWTAILRPGRLDVLSFDIHGSTVDVHSEEIAVNSGGLARFIYDTRSGAADLPRRIYLKDLLSKSMSQAHALGVTAIDAISLVGWGLFWRFLVDRDLLLGKCPGDIAKGAISWTDCMNDKVRALQTLDWLQATFNGGLLPFEQAPQHYTPAVFSTVLGNIAAGATHQGQLRLPTDWDEINFAHVPVGLLSEVYEAFTTELDKPAAKSQSIHYTPRHLAEFLVGEVMSTLGEVTRPCVLDPAVGAGVFLITVLRALVMREWEQSQQRPCRTTIRRILKQQLFAFDIDQRALRLTRLGLYLTALELDPDPSPVEDLKFDNLDANLRLLPGQDGSLGPVAREDQGRFDLVLGNPPWTGHDASSKKRWESYTGGGVRARLGEEAESFQLPDANPDLAFLWRAGEWAKPGAQIALILHGRCLFGMAERAFRARRQLLTAFHLSGILNGADLRNTGVWPNMTAPFCLLFARNEVAPENGALQFVSPFVESETQRGQSVLRVDWGDAQAIPHQEIRAIPWMLKARFRGDAQAFRVLTKLMGAGVRLDAYLQSLKPGLEFRNGYQVGGAVGKQQDASHLMGLPDLKQAKVDSFLVNTAELPLFQRATLLRPRDPDIYQAPLLLVGESISADILQPRAIRATQALVYHESFHGLTLRGVAQADEHARYLQILLQSQLALFICLLTDARYGVEREVLYKENLSSLCVIPLAQLSQIQLQRMRAISIAMEQGLDQALFAELNDFVFDVYGLNRLERQVIEDTLATRSPTAVKRATQPPTAPERARFVGALKETLDDVLQAVEAFAYVKEVAAEGLPWRLLTVSTRGEPDCELPLAALLKAADETGASLLVVPVSTSQVWLALPDRYRHWTPSQAVLLAHELMGGALGNV